MTMAQSGFGVIRAPANSIIWQLPHRYSGRSQRCSEPALICLSREVSSDFHGSVALWRGKRGLVPIVPSTLLAAPAVGPIGTCPPFPAALPARHRAWFEILTIECGARIPTATRRRRGDSPQRVVTRRRFVQRRFTALTSSCSAPNILSKELPADSRTRLCHSPSRDAKHNRTRLLCL